MLNGACWDPKNPNEFITCADDGYVKKNLSVTMGTYVNNKLDTFLLALLMKG